MSLTQSLHILVVDEDARNQKLLRDLLEYKGHHVYGVDDGARALECAYLLRPDLILMDMHIPTLDAVTLASKLRHDQATRRITLVAVTAMAMKGDEERVLNAGFHGYITKPINTRTFNDQVMAIVEGVRRQRAPG